MATKSLAKSLAAFLSAAAAAAVGFSACVLAQQPAGAQQPGARQAASQPVPPSRTDLEQATFDWATQQMAKEMRMTVREIQGRRKAKGLPLGVTYEMVRRTGIAQFFEVWDYNGDGVADEADIAARLRVEKAARRGSYVGGKLAFDLDGDGRITRAELESALRIRAARTVGAAIAKEAEAGPAAGSDIAGTDIAGRIAKQLGVVVAAELAADTDKDEVLTLDEIAAAFEGIEAKRKVYADPDGIQKFVKALDTDRDGKVSIAEFESAMRASFTVIDTDRDGTVSAEELVEPIVVAR
jgi:Ca2+-binding EF-hand superfamily protein